MADNQDNGNGRVTLAILQTDIRHLTSEVGRLADLLGKTCADQSAQRDRILTLEQQRIADAKGWKDLSDRVDQVSARDIFGGIGASLLAIIAGAISWLRQP